jgi:phosphoribosyl-AMP cyclohydrolase
MVRMLAWANRDALAATLATGAAHFWSRSRQASWRKGETSGNTLAVREVRIDCDGDVVLYTVDPTGPSCHTGQPSCFFRHLDAAGVHDEIVPASTFLTALAREIDAHPADVIAKGGASAWRSRTWCRRWTLGCR